MSLHSDTYPDSEPIIVCWCVLNGAFILSLALEADTLTLYATDAVLFKIAATPHGNVLHKTICGKSSGKLANMFGWLNVLLQSILYMHIDTDSCAYICNFDYLPVS